jgi:hypothetical protein
MKYVTSHEKATVVSINPQRIENFPNHLFPLVRVIQEVVVPCLRGHRGKDLGVRFIRGVSGTSRHRGHGRSPRMDGRVSVIFARSSFFSPRNIHVARRPLRVERKEGTIGEFCVAITDACNWLGGTLLGPQRNNGFMRPQRRKVRRNRMPKSNVGVRDERLLVKPMGRPCFVRVDVQGFSKPIIN